MRPLTSPVLASLIASAAQLAAEPAHGQANIEVKGDTLRVNTPARINLEELTKLINGYCQIDAPTNHAAEVTLAHDKFALPNVGLKRGPRS